jgi:hypothetical protein
MLPLYPSLTSGTIVHCRLLANLTRKMAKLDKLQITWADSRHLKMTPVQVMPHVGTPGPRVLELLYQGVSASRDLGKSRGHLGTWAPGQISKLT